MDMNTIVYGCIYKNFLPKVYTSKCEEDYILEEGAFGWVSQLDDIFKLVVPTTWVPIIIHAVHSCCIT